MSGYSAQNLWRTRQFFDAYRDQSKLSAQLRELSWTHNLLILGKSKREPSALPAKKGGKPKGNKKS